MPAVVVGMVVVAMAAGAAAVVAAGRRRVTRALAVMVRALAAAPGVRTTLVTRSMRSQRVVKVTPTEIGRLISHARLIRNIEATAAAVHGRNINARSKRVGMVVPASRHVAFHRAAVDSSARAADGRADAGKYCCGGPRWWAAAILRREVGPRPRVISIRLPACPWRVASRSCRFGVSSLL